MSNTSRAKGTKWENEIRDTWLWRIWPTARRAGNLGINDYGDFANVDGWLIEAKNRKNIQLTEWIRMVYTKIERQGREIGKSPWVIAFKGDRRTWLKESLVVTPAWLFFKVVEQAKLYDESQDPPDTRTTAEWLESVRQGTSVPKPNKDFSFSTEGEVTDGGGAGMEGM
jgi:hypothetical protein